MIKEPGEPVYPSFVDVTGTLLLRDEFSSLIRVNRLWRRVYTETFAGVVAGALGGQLGWNDDLVAQAGANFLQAGTVAPVAGTGDVRTPAHVLGDLTGDLHAIPPVNAATGPAYRVLWAWAFNNAIGVNSPSMYLLPTPANWLSPVDWTVQIQATAPGANLYYFDGLAAPSNLPFNPVPGILDNALILDPTGAITGWGGPSAQWAINGVLYFNQLVPFLAVPADHGFMGMYSQAGPAGGPWPADVFRTDGIAIDTYSPGIVNVSRFYNGETTEPIPCDAYRFLTWAIAGTGFIPGATVVLEASLDNVNWFPVYTMFGAVGGFAARFMDPMGMPLCRFVFNLPTDYDHTGVQIFTNALR